MPVLEIEKIKLTLEEFLARLMQASGLELAFHIRTEPENPADPEAPEITVDFAGADTDLLLSHGGELLEALEDVAIRVLRLPTAERAKIAFDCQDYKMLRMEELRLTAEAATEKVLHSGAPFALNPMNSRERRIIHLALKDNPAVRTESQGFGPHRKVVIFPAGKK